MTAMKNSIIFYYVWAGGLLMARYTPARGETIAWHYSQDGQMLGFTLNGVPYFYVRNIQGDVVSVIDLDGNVVAWYTYCAWGNILDTWQAVGYNIGEINPIRYRGYYWDSETQLFYLQSRYYSPELRRFVSADVFLDTGVGILGTNMYIYCNNDPVNLWDPTGYSPLHISLDDINNFLSFFPSWMLNFLNIDDEFLTRIAAYLGARQYVRSQRRHRNAEGFHVTGDFDPNTGIFTGQATWYTDGQKWSMEITTSSVRGIRARNDAARAAHTAREQRSEPQTTWQIIGHHTWRMFTRAANDLETDSYLSRNKYGRWVAAGVQVVDGVSNIPAAVNLGQIQRIGGEIHGVPNSSFQFRSTGRIVRV